jgi:unsaturated rhamnogalacturonyl hydrolase
MKTTFQHFAVAGIIFLAANFRLHAQPAEITQLIRPPPPVTLTASLPSEIKPYPVLAAMQRVADWQLAHPATNDSSTSWLLGAENAGMMALAGISGDPKYREAMRAAGEANGWRLGPSFYNADDYCVGQAYTELYFLYRENRMIAPLRERFDAILAKPPDVVSLEFTKAESRDRKNWSWCDSLFMGPPTWLRLYAATDDQRYLDFAVTNWWRTTDYLYDTNEHLFFRDSTFFQKREPNGKKVFWSRGNGWVIAGLVRTLQYLPMNHPDRPRFEQLFKEMAEKVLACQQPDGLWRASLLDPDSYPAKETSGSGFFTYALAWGVNQRLLDRAKFEPAVRKGWKALVGCVKADGKLTHVQPVGSDPKKFADDSTAPYGVGAFLLASSEIYRTAVLENAKLVAVKVSNPASFRRDCETVELVTKGFFKTKGGFSKNSDDLLDVFRNSAKQIAVMDGTSSRILDSQTESLDLTSPSDNVAEKLLFQVDLAPGETRTFYILDASALAAVPPPIVKTTAHYVPERHDDFSWENDRIAHRMFGKALETWQEEPLTSSGVDVWIKRTRSLVANEMYRTGQNYDTNWVMQDDYKVGKTRGCGGIGIWDGRKLYVSQNWRTYKIITTGPIRSEFELTYDAWDAGKGRMVSETKRISIDAGSNLSRVESTFSSDDKSPLTIGVGLAERPGENTIVDTSKIYAGDFIYHWQNSIEKGLVVQNQSWMTYWQPQDFAKGTIGTAIILPKGSIKTFTNDNPNLPPERFAPPTKTMTEGQPALRNILAIAPADIGKPFVYYLGAGWSESGDFPDAKSWADYVRRFAERRDQPLQVTIGN